MSESLYKEIGYEVMLDGVFSASKFVGINAGGCY